MLSFRSTTRVVVSLLLLTIPVPGIWAHGASETQGSFSWDAATLSFGRAPGPEGSTDIFVSS